MDLNLTNQEIMAEEYREVLNLYLTMSECSSCQELYIKLKIVAKYKLGLDRLPFSLLALEHPPGANACEEIMKFLAQCNETLVGNKSNDDDAINLVKFLKDNPPEESYENPQLSDSQPTQDEKDFIWRIFCRGIDLPGSWHNPFGHLQYFSSFFIDMFFGNYTEFNDHIKTLSKEELDKAMKKREGYCQHSPVFAPILGLKMIDIESQQYFTSQEVQEIRIMYSGCNEHKHLDILKELIRLGADVNAHDINGFTPLHYALRYCNEDMVTALLKHGANPNFDSRIDIRPISVLANGASESRMKLLDILIQHKASVINKKEINRLRSTTEMYGSKDLAMRFREAHPRDKEECEKCMKHTPKQCGACGKVYY